MMRELWEETGAVSAEHLGETDWMSYEFPPYDGPPSHRLAKFRGQRQKWFALRFTGHDDEIDHLVRVGVAVVAGRQVADCVAVGRAHGHRARGRADVEDLGRVAERHVDVVHGPALVRLEPPPGDVHEEVEQARAAVVSAVDEHEPAATRPRERALGHPRRERRRNARVDGVAALGEHARARVGGQRVAGGDRTPHRSSVIRR